MPDSSVVRASGICLEGPGFNPQSGHLFCLTQKALPFSTTANTVTTATQTHLELHPKFLRARQPLPPSKSVRSQFFFRPSARPPPSDPWFGILVPPPPWHFPIRYSRGQTKATNLFTYQLGPVGIFQKSENHRNR